MVLQRNMAKIVDMASVDLSIYFARVKRRFDTKGTKPLRRLGEENGDATQSQETLTGIMDTVTKTSAWARRSNNIGLAKNISMALRRLDNVSMPKNIDTAKNVGGRWY